MWVNDSVRLRPLLDTCTTVYLVASCCQVRKRNLPRRLQPRELAQRGTHLRSTLAICKRPAATVFEAVPPSVPTVLPHFLFSCAVDTFATFGATSERLRLASDGWGRWDLGDPISHFGLLSPGHSDDLLSSDPWRLRPHRCRRYPLRRPSRRCLSRVPALCCLRCEQT
jgi:hypothetical protein